MILNNRRPGEDNAWVCVWSSAPTSGDSSVWWTRSSDGGAAWSEPEEFDAISLGGDTLNEIYPNVTTDSNGNWIAVWGLMNGFTGVNIAVANSTDDGETWSSAASPFSPAPPMTANIWMPRVQYGLNGEEQHWRLVWAESDSAADTPDFEIKTALRVGSGSWGSPDIVNSDFGDDTQEIESTEYHLDDLQPAIAFDSTYGFMVVWRSKT